MCDEPPHKKNKIVDLARPPSVEAEPVAGFPARSDNDFYRLTLRLMEI